MPATEVMKATEKNGFTKITVNRAREKIGIKSKKGEGKYSKWVWKL